jgi:pimeloyl-ACP methyl ester carboxylesterase
MATRYAATTDVNQSLTSQTVTGGGGVQLHVVEGGNPRGRPIVFLHGFSQCWLTWSRQLHSDLAGDFRLVALDLRGHGQSEKPTSGYDDSRLWAADVDAVIRTLRLNQPVLCGWSYGPLVILDYLRHYGENNIGGINFVGAITKLGSAEAMAVITPALQSLVPGLFANETEASVSSLAALLRLCYDDDLAADDWYRALGYSVTVPPSVRQALFSRSFDNDDLLPKIQKPVLVTHGVHDAVVDPIVVEQHRARLAHAQIHLVANAGHTPFWGAAAAFNRDLRTFCESL